MSGSVCWLPATPKSKRPHWRIEASPHIMMKLKQVFSKIDKREIGICYLLDSPENARDLQWFLDRYPLKVSSLDRLSASAEVYRQNQARVQGILAGGIQLERALKMTLPPREYQQLAADLVATTGRLLLGDEVGLGKTITSIAAIASSGKLPALIVTLTHLPTQWQKEFQRFLPSVTTHIIKQVAYYDFQADVIICNYHKLTHWAEYLKGRVRTIVFDEAQELRRATSNGVETKKWSAAYAIASEAEIRLHCTATPIYNYGGEIFNLMQVLDPDCLGSEDEFHREWCYGSGDKASLKDPAALGTHLRDAGLMLRRTRADVNRELPPLHIIPYQIEADRKALKAVENDVLELAKLLLDEESTYEHGKFRAAGQMDMKIRRATGLAKAGFVAEFVKMLVQQGEKVVVFGWHHDFYDALMKSLREYRPALYTGEQSVKQKQASVARFTDGDTPIIILSLRSGAGLDGLQFVCRNVVFGELDWSPGVHHQCMGRVHRDGQMDPVNAYFLHSDRGSDPIVMDVLGVKKGQSDGIIDPDAELVESGIDPDHLKKLAAEFLRQADGRVREVNKAEPDELKPEPVKALKWQAQPRFEQPSLFDEVAS